MGSLAVLVGMGHVTYAHLSLSLPLGSFSFIEFTECHQTAAELRRLVQPVENRRPDATSRVLHGGLVYDASDWSCHVL